MRRKRRSNRSGSTTRRRILLLGAAAVSGGTLIGTGAFSTVTADRVSDILTTSDADGIIGLSGYADEGTVPTFANNAGLSVDITLDSTEDVEFDVTDNGTWELVPVTFSVGAGASVDVAIRDGGNAGSSADVDITATGTDFSFQATRNFAIPASSVVKKIEATVKSAGNSGQYSFDLENTGNVDVTLTEVGVDSTTNGTATKVGGKKNDGIFLAEGTSVVSNAIDIGGARQPFNPDVSLNAGVTKPFEFDRFRDKNDGNAKMKGDEVTIEVAFSDGSTATLDLVP